MNFCACCVGRATDIWLQRVTIFNVALFQRGLSGSGGGSVKREVRMSALPSFAYEILPPSNRSAEAPDFRSARYERDWFSDRFADGTPSPGKQAPRRHPARLLVMFLLGAAAILALQSYGYAARERLATVSPWLQWLAPPAEPAQDAPDKVEQISRSVDQIAASIAASHQQMTRTIDHLAADQEQMTRELVRLQTLSHQPAAGARKADRRSSQAR
jgi:hypothetical protein